ncbi:MAG TPA: glucoamylase family protein, partial [Lacunisphaera sp.]|nr:glucoamylase family protein [Lacunisphaera sp.]
DGVDRLLETLEIHHLANRDDYLHFALLTDFRDAPAENQPGDDSLVARAVAGVERLNGKYPAKSGSTFFLLHRPRRWNAGEGRWMGYERKRGKLAEFNALLRGGAARRFSVVIGGTTILPAVKYVITLDTDTQLPRDAARKLVGTMAHPLNRPVFDATRGIVTEGYGILQPRVGVSLPSSRRSWFVRLLAGDAGIDPYTREVSDVYQDVFQQGSFIGKGIYEVDAFDRALRGRFPENTVLSHDLLESCHVRSGLVSDVEFYEEHPSRYNVDVNRRHRWIRGDWQITQWLLPRVPGADARRIANPLSGLSQWKLLDNLRRSLVPVALLALLLGTWLVRPAPNVMGSLLVLALMTFPSVLAALVQALRKPADLPLMMHLRGVANTSSRQAGQILLGLAFLPYDAFVSLDAIGRALLRLWVTRKRLLEWQTSGDAEQGSHASLAGFCRTMWIAPVVALATGLLLFVVRPDQLMPVLPFLGLWLAAPWIAWWISQPITKSAPNLSNSQRDFLRRTARRTWHYFETFVTAEENWLPPDNYQEFPVPVIAARTSPTNMGLALLANQAAVDFGYLSVGGLIRRTQDAMAAMQKLERHRGHFYNWYETRSLRPLPPLYVSVVDSGNLAGHLMTLGAGLRELADQPIFAPQVFRGLRDTIQVLLELSPGNTALVKLEEELATDPATLPAVFALLQKAARLAAEPADQPAEATDELKSWTQTFHRNCAEQLADLTWLAPWLVLPTHGHPGVGAAQTERVPTLREVATWESDLEADRAGGEDLARCRREAAEHARERLVVLEALASQSDELAAMDFAFMFNEARDLFCTGFNVTDRRCDAGCYDLLASEARLGSYVAIALGQVRQDHWFSLGRLLVASGGQPLLVSWSGSMFEYLMPLLVMPNYANTLLDHTCRAAVREQMEYGELRGVPWGISESGYNRTDTHLNYQYRAFGVPGLGFKRGLAEDLVVAPYAAAMALMVAPVDACKNLERLAAEGRRGRYGFYEAVDYTPVRLRPDETSATVQSFMVHHQGMSLLALDNLLQNFPLHRRFMACPLLKATDLLLQERMPNAAAGVLAEDLKLEENRPLAGVGGNVLRVFTNPGLPAPEVHLLSNGRYHVAITSTGGGYSRWRDLAVTRWREDATRDNWGMFIYLRDVGTGDLWSVAHQPVLRRAKGDEAIFTEARAEFRSRPGDLDVHTEICVSPEDDVELRRVTITNLANEAREIELTSYAEVVLARPEADAAHPAFSNLFVQTEFVPKSSALLCTRRARAAGEAQPWLLHLLVGQGGTQGKISCETDRGRFVGRGGSLVRPAALQEVAPLSDTVGSVLDPIVALRRTISLPPGASTVLDVVLGMAESRVGALALVEKYQSARMADRAFDVAWTHGQVTLRQLNATEPEAQLYGRLASALIYADPVRRASPAVLRSNRRGQSALWSHGISGDLPIVLLTISDAAKIELARQLVSAHAYWRLKGLATELVILSEEVSVYHQSLHEQVTSLVATGSEGPMLDKPGGIFVRRLEQIPQEDRMLLHSVARIVIDEENGTLAQQLDRRSIPDPVIPALVPTRSELPVAAPALPARELIFPNGLGGFTRDGHEYVITLGPGQMTPAPWVNVIANPTFGTVVSESGSAYTWLENAHEFRLTPWSNDPVQDPTGEALYIRDEQTGQFWSPTPLPARGATPYVVRHGFGYTVFEHTEHGLTSELWVYVAMDAPVKFSVLKLRNVSGRPRRVSVTGYWEWVLGDLRAKSLLHVQTEVDLKTGALLARNYYN